MDSQTYRIEVRAKSHLYYCFIFFITVIWFWAIWLWPYYLSNGYRISLAVLLVMIVVADIRRKEKIPAVLTLCQSGRIIKHKGNSVGGWLKPNSKAYPGFFYLSYLPDMAKVTQSWVIYVDQLNDLDRRRISRALSAIKASSEQG